MPYIARSLWSAVIPILAESWSMPCVIADSTVFIKIYLTAEMSTKSVRTACVNVLNVAKLDSSASYNMLSLVCYR
jgi:hypothetical protein